MNTVSTSGHLYETVLGLKIICADSEDAEFSDSFFLHVDRA